MRNGRSRSPPPPKKKKITGIESHIIFISWEYENNIQTLMSSHPTNLFTSTRSVMVTVDLTWMPQSTNLFTCYSKDFHSSCFTNF
jgi:hypothetical protein